MEDSFLIRQVLGGHRDAFRLLVVRYQRPLFRFLGGFGLEQAAAEELAQETFLRAYRNLSGYDADRASFSSWLFTIAKHLAMNETASSRRRVPHVEVEAIGEVVADQLDGGVRVPDGFADRVMATLADAPSPTTGIERVLGRRAVQLALANLGLVVAVTNIIRFVLGVLMPAAGLGGAR